MKKLLDWLDDRSGYRAVMTKALDERVRGGASFAYVFGSVLTFVLILQMVTGVFLAMYYSASSSDAWASVAFIQDQVSAGWFIRGLHSYGASAMVILAGLHLLQVALYGAYKKPRELNWIVGVLMLGLILGFALTGYLLPWDQTGYWATKVATGIAGTSPVAGEQLQQAMQGGNEYGNLTITRFYAIHVFLLPALMVTMTIVHIALFRKHSQTPPWWLSEQKLDERTQPFWPDQMFKDMLAMAAIFAVLVGINLMSHGVGLEAPADPSSNFDARPEWYFRALFQSLKYFGGPLETVVALGTPVLVGGVLLALPFVDRGPSRSPMKRLPYMIVLFLGFLGAGTLTVISIVEDKNDPQVQENLEYAHEQAEKARFLAKTYGVPPAGGMSVFTMEPGYRVKKRFEDDCASCHQGPDREGPEIVAGFGSRRWISDFLQDPSGDRFFGRTKIQDMKPAEQTGDDLKALVEFVYSQSAASDVDEALAKRGEELFDDGNCSDCHSADWETEGEAGPNLGRRGTAEMWAAFIKDPKHARWFGEKNEMPSFANRYTDEQVNELADFLVKLRSQSPEPAIESE